MRRTKPEPKEFQPDIRFQSVYVTTMIHHCACGKKTQESCSDALDMSAAKDRSPSDRGRLEQALRNVGPQMEVRPRRVGGATYQVPMEVAQDRRVTLAMRWILDAAKSRGGKSFAEKLSMKSWMQPIIRVLPSAS